MIDFKKICRVIGFDLDQTLYPKSPEIDAAIQTWARLVNPDIHSKK